MKIDCPHCGVHGSVDDSFAGKKLRCPKCSKVFLLAEDILPEVDDGTSMMGQEISPDKEPPISEPVAQGLMATEADELVELEEVSLEGETAESEEITEEKLPEIQEDDSPAEEAFEEDDVLDLMDDEGEEEPVALETCSGCGESLEPEFLETIGSKRLCALCLPDGEEEETPEDSVEEEVDIAQDEELLEIETESDQASTDDDLDEADSIKETCSVCGEKFHPDFLQEVDSKLYCGICQPEVVETVTDDEVVAAGAAATVAATAAVALATDSEIVEIEEAGEEELQENVTDFSVGDLLKEAWQKTKGAKASIVAGLLFMYGILFAISLGGWYGFQGMAEQTDPTTAMGLNIGLQAVTSWFSGIFTAGLMLMGIRRALEQEVSWTMVFAGFSKALTITIALVLQLILITIGFALLVLPGIYLSVGYALTLPLILEKGLGPWEALEASRRAIHKKWWTVFGLYLVMMLLVSVSAIPLGLGLIWTLPMFFVLIGILYVRFFGSDEIAGEEVEDAEDSEAEEEEIEDAAEEQEIVSEESK